MRTTKTCWMALMLATMLSTSCGCVKLTTARSQSVGPANAQIAIPPELEIDFQQVTTAVDPGPPSNHRPWRTEQAILPFSTLARDGATVHNVRQCRWKTPSEKGVYHADWTFKWEDVEGVDFVVVPFKKFPTLSHTMLSFRLSDGRALVLSVEARLERGEVYSPWAGAARKYELMYVIGDEPDLYGLRAFARDDDVYLYTCSASRIQARDMLKSVLLRTNALAAQPEYYDSIRNNCTTNLLDHAFELRNEPSQSLQPLDQVRSRVPISSDRMAYNLGLIDRALPFEQAKQKAWISSKIRQYMGAPEFSRLIRQ